MINEGTDTVKDITFEISEDVSLGENRKEVWVYAKHPDISRFPKGTVGFVSARKIDPEKRSDYLPDEEQQDRLLDLKSWADFDHLRHQIGVPNAELWAVDRSTVNKKFRGEGIGQVLYIRLLKHLAEKYNAVCVPNSAYEGEGTTSFLAMNVWRALKNIPGIVSVGHVYWGGEISDPKPLRPRRHHGWATKKQDKKIYNRAQEKKKTEEIQESQLLIKSLIIEIVDSLLVK